jgi:hypothetical protein
MTKPSCLLALPFCRCALFAREGRGGRPAHQRVHPQAGFQLHQPAVHPVTEHPLHALRGHGLGIALGACEPHLGVCAAEAQAVAEIPGATG